MDRRLERGRATRAELLGVATELFTELGYENVSIELVLARAGVSRGSLYHHFASKEALFEAVLDTVEARVAEKLVSAARGIDDPAAALEAGCQAFLSLARDPEVRQIVLIDAPAALGWARWREIDARHAFGIMRTAVAAVAKQRPLQASPDVVAHVLLAGLIELAMVVARAERPRAALADSRSALSALISSMLS